MLTCWRHGSTGFVRAAIAAAPVSPFGLPDPQHCPFVVARSSALRFYKALPKGRIPRFNLTCVLMVSAGDETSPCPNYTRSKLAGVRYSGPTCRHPSRRRVAYSVSGVPRLQSVISARTTISGQRITPDGYMALASAIPNPLRKAVRLGVTPRLTGIPARHPTRKQTSASVSTSADGAKPPANAVRPRSSGRWSAGGKPMSVPPVRGSPRRDHLDPLRCTS